MREKNLERFEYAQKLREFSQYKHQDDKYSYTKVVLFSGDVLGLLTENTIL
jgi:hypothetical protein